MTAKLLTLTAIALWPVALQGAPGEDVSTDSSIKVATRPVLRDSSRHALDRLIRYAEKCTGNEMPARARTIEEAIKLGEISRKYTWCIEYDGWFVFTDSISANGEPFFWSTALVKKGTRKLVHLQNVW